MRVGIITGSGTYALAGLQVSARQTVATAWGETEVTEGSLAGVDVLHISRHGEGHVRLSNHVTHQANIWAMKELGADAVIGLSACGAVDPTVELGSLIVFDDLHFLANRLPGGEVCSFHLHPGAPDRGHWVYDSPYSEPLRRALVEGAAAAGLPVRDRGCYGHVDGPRFNTRAEIAALAACGVTAVSQTGGPETVLCGEAELPFALIGFATDYANGVADEATPMETLVELLGRSAESFGAVIAGALPLLAAAEVPGPLGSVLRFE
ncbi:MAG: MTAP family purine nucleoside phosphorylase [Solirubrobacteraceae bacterium]|nr:MAG: phosphorylase [Solirubrobacterales bacterium]